MTPSYGFSYRQKGQFFAVDAKSGETLWSGPGRAADNASLVHAGGFLFLLKEDGELMVTEPNTSFYFDVIRQYTVANSPTWAHPVIVGSSLYIKDAETLDSMGAAVAGRHRSWPLLQRLSARRSQFGGLSCVDR